MTVYGHDKTIHGTTHLDVEVRDGRVVAVWFRCMALPFVQHNTNLDRALEMDRMYADGITDWELHAVEVKGREPSE